MQANQAALSIVSLASTSRVMVLPVKVFTKICIAAASVELKLFGYSGGQEVLLTLGPKSIYAFCRLGFGCEECAGLSALATLETHKTATHGGIVASSPVP